MGENMSECMPFWGAAFVTGLALGIVIGRKKGPRERLNRKQKKILLGMVVAEMLVIAADVGLVYLKVVDTLQILGLITAILVINVVGIALAVRAR